MASCCSAKPKKENFFTTTKGRMILLAFSLALSVLSFLWEKNIIGHNAVLKYFNPGWIVIAICGVPIFIAAYHGVFHERKIKSSLLISTAILGSIVLEILIWSGVSAVDGHGHGYVFAAAEIAFLMSLGGFIEDVTVKRTKKGIERMIHLAPDKAYVKLGNNLIVTEVSRIQPGNIVVVRPNDMVPVDGVIVSGQTAIDQSSITGESVPCDKVAGDPVYAGTWNKSGAIEVKVTKAGNDTTVAKLIKLVEEAEGKKAPISRIADKWASIIVPLAMGLGVVVFFVAKFAFDISWLEAAIRGVTVLVVFCPCALVLATPTAVAAGIGTLAYRGVMVKSGKALEDLARVQIVAFDKTGTLTTSQIAVSDVFFRDINEKEFWTLAGSSESNSEHPIAKAITAFAKTKAEVITPESVKSLIGVGVESVVEGKTVRLAKWAHFEGSDAEVSAAAEKFLQNGLTVIGMSVNGKVAGVIAVSDTVRAESAQAVKTLQAQGYETVMLTGDNGSAAARIAEICGISSVWHSLLPEQKLEKINEFIESGKSVCMVGDGVNDAPSLAAANCGVAMGALGSDVAIETADVALMHNKIQLIPGLLRVSKKVLVTIKRNIVIAMTINFIAVLLSMFGILDPVFGALVHNFTSLLVVLSSAFILTDKEKTGNRKIGKDYICQE